MQRKQRQINKKLDGKDLRIGIAVAEFNADITERLLLGAERALAEAGVSERNIKIVRVSGSFELPLACLRLAKTGKYDALLALGCVIKGETDHYYYIAGEASRGIMQVMLSQDIPIGFGVLTVNTLKQAEARVSKKIDIGGSTARAVLKAISVH